VSTEQRSAAADPRRIVFEVGNAAPPAAPAQHEFEARAWSSDHPVNLRLSLPLPFGRYYVTLVAGKERRCAERRAEERRKHPLLTPGNVIFLLLSILVGLAFLGLLELAVFSMLMHSGSVVVM